MSGERPRARRTAPTARTRLDRRQRVRRGAAGRRASAGARGVGLGLGQHGDDRRCRGPARESIVISPFSDSTRNFMPSRPCVASRGWLGVEADAVVAHADLDAAVAARRTLTWTSVAFAYLATLVSASWTSR